MEEVGSTSAATRAAPEKHGRSLFVPVPQCALCKDTLDPRGEYFRASGTFLRPNDPLTAYCNAPLHWDCYARWPERPRFARQYVKAWAEANRRNPFWWRVFLDDAVYVSVNPQAPVEEISVRLQAVGSDIRVPLRRWSEWLHAPAKVVPGLKPLELEALTVVLEKLRDRFPTDYAIIDAINPDEKLPRRRRVSTSPGS